MIRKFYILLIILLTISCNTEDLVSTDSDFKITPPVWIVGTWLSQDSMVSPAGLKFTEDDFISFDADGVENSAKVTYSLLKLLDSNLTVLDRSTNDSYTISFKYTNREDQHIFTKVSNNEIQYQLNGKVYERKP